MMKNISFTLFIILLVLISNFYTTIAEDLSFDVTSINHQYRGTVYFKNKVIIYNTNGRIMYSEDKGNSWKQKDIDKNYYIQKILPIDSVLVGLLSRDYFIKSSDGLNWEKIPVGSDEQFQTFDYCNGKYYVLGLYSISIYNNSFELDTIIRVSDKEVLENIAANKDKFLITRPYHKVIHYDANTYTVLDTITVSPTQYAMGLTNLKKLGDTLYLIYENNTLARSNDFGYTWDSIAYPAKYYQIYNNELYRVIGTDDKKYNGLTTFSFEKFSPQSVWDTISVTKYDRMAVNLFYYLQDIVFIDSMNVLICGEFRHISKSTDGGHTWELKCNFYGKSNAQWFDEKRAVATPGKAIFYHTCDGGVIWLPNKITDSYTKYFEENKVRRTYLSYFDIKPNGEVFTCYPNNNLEYGETDSFICKFKSNDYGNSFEAMLDTNITFQNSSREYYYVKWNGNITIAFQTYYRSNYYFVNLDSEFNTFWKNTKIEKNVHGIAYYNDRFYIVASEEKTIVNSSDTNKYMIYSLMQSNDTCKTWQNITELYRVEVKANYLNIFTAVNFEDNTIRVASQTFINEMSNPSQLVEWKLFEFHPSSGEKLNECIIDTSIYFTSLPYTKYKNYYIYFSNGDPIYNDTNTSICEWKHLEDFGLFSYNTTIGDVIYGVNDDGIAKLTPKGYVSINETENTEAKDYMYILNPYPIPGKNIITTPVYCDMTVAANPLKAEVYNMNGELVSLPNSITITRQNNFIALVEWNCSSVPAGVYLISFSYGNNSHTIRCVVEGK